MTRSECLDCKQNASRIRNAITRLKSVLGKCAEEEKILVFDLFCKRILDISEELDRCQH